MAQLCSVVLIGVPEPCFLPKSNGHRLSAPYLPERGACFWESPLCGHGRWEEAPPEGLHGSVTALLLASRSLRTLLYKLTSLQQICVFDLNGGGLGEQRETAFPLMWVDLGGA